MLDPDILRRIKEEKDLNSGPVRIGSSKIQHMVSQMFEEDVECQKLIMRSLSVRQQY
jgi:hypothetical protein